MNVIILLSPEKRGEKRDEMKEVTIYTDGACSGNPGEGGWGAVIMYKGTVKKISGYSEMTTNNIMELTAVIEGVGVLKEKCRINIFTDSKYIVDSVTMWLPNWIKNGWKTSSKKPVKNVECWKKIVELLNFHEIKWNWVKGHDGNIYNEECDRMAREEILIHKKSAVL